MRIACFYNDLHPAAAAALAAHAPQAELVDTNEDTFTYWREVRNRWDRGDSLLVIEQDIEIGPGMVKSLEACPRDWCCYAYEIFEPPVLLEIGFGCTKFSVAAQQAADYASVKAEPGCPGCDASGFRCWDHFDLATAEVLARAGFSPHVHGEVTHHHDYGPTGLIMMSAEPLPLGMAGSRFSTSYSWTPETGSVYVKGTRPGPRETWGITGVRLGVS